jgi:acylphosphatase
MRHCQIYVKGKVQGVFFRRKTKETADLLGVKGWVKNLPDGSSVLIEAQGTNESVSKLIEWCGTGPKNAMVERVEVKELLDESSLFSSFEIVY